MQSQKLAGLIAGSLALLIISILTLNWYLLLFLTPLLILLFFGLTTYTNEQPPLTITRTLNETNIFENTTITVTLTITNTGRTFPCLEIIDELPARTSLHQGSNYAIITLTHNETITLTYELSCPIRGHYTIGPLHLRSRDHLGLFYKETTHPDTTSLTVLPRLQPLRGITLTTHTNPYPGMMYTKRAGIGTEFYGIRDYTPGDSYKHINWKALARWNHVMVNEYEKESTTDLILILDARTIQHQSGTILSNPIEHNIKAAASIASQFLKHRDRVGLITYGAPEGKLTWLYPESGNTQLTKLIRELVATTSTGDATLKTAIDTAALHLLPHKSLIILLSSLEDDPSLPKAIETLNAHAKHLIILSPSPLKIEVNLHPRDHEYQTAYRILSLERTTYLNRLRTLGAQIVDWDTSQPLALALKEVEPRKIKR